jgi:patatin-like phospholipase/acyl hydrolase
VLCIDGGGVRGLIPLEAMRALEEEAGRPIAELFDVIFGTSTGGLIAASLTLPDEQGAPKWSVESLIKDYAQFSKEAFTSPWYHKLLGVNGIVGSLYLSQWFDNLITQRFRGYQMSDLLVNFVMPCYDLLENNAFFFYSRQFSNHPSRNFWVGDVVAACTAAPVFFNPVEVCSIDGTRTAQAIDTGIYMDNPTLINITIY